MPRIVTGFGRLWGFFLLILITLFAFLRQSPSSAAWIIFTSDRTGTAQIFRIRSDGSSLQRLSKTDDGYAFPEFSPDGREILAVADINQAYRLYQLSSDGQPNRGIGEVRYVSYPRWSPDGQWIALSAEHDGRRFIFRLRPDGSQLEQLTNQPAFDSSPTWSPDSQWLIYSTADFNGRQRLLRMLADGTNVSEIATDVIGPNTPSWSPDGEWIVFAAFQDTESDIFKIRPNATDLQRLTTHPQDDEQPAWSPHSEWLVFVSARDGNENLYRMRVDGTDLRRLTDHPATDSLPNWSPIIDLTVQYWQLLIFDVGLWMMGAMVIIRHNQE